MTTLQDVIPFAPQKKSLNPFVLNERGDTVTVCAWCFPQDKIFEKFPELRGKVAISHTVCDQHDAQIRRENELNTVGAL